MLDISTFYSFICIFNALLVINRYNIKILNQNYQKQLQKANFVSNTHYDIMTIKTHIFINE